MLISPLVILRLQWYVQGCWMREIAHWLFWGRPLTALDRALLFLLALPIPWEKAWGWSLELESPWNSEHWPFLASTPGHWFPLSRGPSPFPLSVSSAGFPCCHLLHSGCPPRIKDLGGSWVPWSYNGHMRKGRGQRSPQCLYIWNSRQANEPVSVSSLK